MMRTRPLICACRSSLHCCGLGFASDLAYHDGEAGTLITVMALNCYGSGPTVPPPLLACSTAARQLAGG